MALPCADWTRRDWEALADRMLLAVRPHATPDHALIDLPGPESHSGRWSDRLEGFARTFLLAAFRLAQSGEQDPHNFAEWYAAGLAAGTDPGSPHRWPTFAEKNQAKVECASIALALHETRPWIWDRLDDATRQRVVDWMAPIIGAPVWDNNWRWFQAVTEAFLRSVGGPWEPADIELTVARTEAWYAGDGWYSDGELLPGQLRSFDYYCWWAMHFYPLWYCRISGTDADPALASRYRRRLTRFLQDAQHLVGADGAPLLQGRSQTYRFAMLAPFWAGAIFDATPLPPGRTRRLAGKVLCHFVDAGCLDESGLLPLGWHRAFPLMREPYSGPGSPYWASKGFAGLVLPADDPVWTDAAELLPIEEHDVALALPAPGWLVSGTAADGIVRIVQHGGDRARPDRPSIDDAGYARHGYATHAAPDVERAAPVDNHVALLAPDGRPSLRRPWQRLYLAGRVAVSRHRAHWLAGEEPQPYLWPEQGEYRTGPWLTTASVLRGAHEVRLAVVGAPEPGWPLRIGGWALAADLPPQVAMAGAASRVERPDGLSSTVIGLRGFTVAGCHRAEGRNALGRHSVTPWVATEGPARPGEVYAALVLLRGAGAQQEDVRSADMWSADVRIAVEATPGGATVVWPDGERDEVPLPIMP